MAYTKYHSAWADADGATGGGDESTPIVAAALDHIETGIFDAATTADAAIPAPDSPDTNNGLFWNGSAWVADTITNAKIDAAAAIAYSKLNLSGSIVNADINASAAIALSKLESAAWSTYAVALSATTTAPTLGSGAVTMGRYMQIGKFVRGYMSILVGTSGFSNGSGDVWVSLPVNAKAPTASAFTIMGQGWYFDGSTSGMYLVVGDYISAGFMQVRYNGGASHPRLTYADPVTWANSDLISIAFAYEAA
jgi:hypothetical protein